MYGSEIVVEISDIIGQLKFEVSEKIGQLDIEPYEKIVRLKMAQKMEHGAFSVNINRRRKPRARKYCNEFDSKLEIRRRDPELSKGGWQIATPLASRRPAASRSSTAPTPSI